MATNIQHRNSVMAALESKSAEEVLNLPEVRKKFTTVYSVIHRVSDEAAQLQYEAEKFHFGKILSDKKELQSCTKLSLYGCFIDMAANGLSFDPAMKLAYVTSFNVNIGTKQAPRYEKRASLMISGFGELSMRMRQGQIKYADNPVLVFKGDKFGYGTTREGFFVEHTAVIPRESEEVIACYIRIERPDGSSDYKVLSAEEIKKLQEVSKDPKSLAWTAGFYGMVQTKTIKHAFRNYPRLRMGEFSRLQTEVVDGEADLTIPSLSYGLDDDQQSPALAPSQPVPQTQAQGVQKQPVQPQAENKSTVNTTVAQGAKIPNDDSFMNESQSKQQSVIIDDDTF